jgi:tetratricopeptide (TPR) repeat protein
LAVFVIAIGPVLGLTPFQFQFTSTVADHYLYLAMFGPAVAVTWALVRFRGNRAALGACGVALAALAVRSHDQLGHWRNEAALWTHTLAVAPNSFVARTNLAADLGRAGYLVGLEAIELRQAGKAEEAAKVEAERLTYHARAVELLEEAIAINPDYITARHNAFVNYLRLKRYDKAAENLEVILAAGDKEPDPELHQRLVPFHESAGEMWSKAGRYARAIPHFERVLAMRPDSGVAKKGLDEARAKLAEARLEFGPER